MRSPSPSRPPRAPTPPTPRWLTLPETPPLPKAALSGEVVNEGARIHYAVFNPSGGRPVVLLHGGFGSSEAWGSEVPRLARNHEVVVVDSRGHGRSTLGDAPLGYRLMSRDVLAVMDALRMPRASVVGVSDGGIIGILLAIDHPERVDRLFAWGANFNTQAEPTSPPDPRLRAVGAAYVARMEAAYRAQSPTPDGFPKLKAALGSLYAHEPDLTVADLARIRAPTVIADGDHEQFISREHTALLARSIPGARLVILPDTSHGGPNQDPAGFHRAVAGLVGVSRCRLDRGISDRFWHRAPGQR